MTNTLLHDIEGPAPRIDSETVLYGVMGHPVGHSLGPVMHNRAFAETGTNAVYLAFDVTDVASAAAGIRALNVRGASVTIPHKTAIMQYLDEIDDAARSIGAVNTVVNRENRLIGYNTDAYGAVSALSEKTGIKGRSIVIAGAGGAARAVGYGMAEQGGRIHIVNRSEDRGRRLAADLNADFHPLNDLSEIDCDILVNTTSVGMYPDTEGIPVPEGILKPGMVVMDIVYNPLHTGLLKAAEAAGCRTVDGLSMFVHQGGMQFRLWTGRKPPIETMRRVVRDALENRNRENS